MVRGVGLGKAPLGGDEHVLSDVLGQMDVPYDVVGDAHHDRVLSAKEVLEATGRGAGLGAPAVRASSSLPSSLTIKHRRGHLCDTICSCGQRAARSLVDGGGCNNGAVSSPRRPAPRQMCRRCRLQALLRRLLPAAAAVARPGRLTKQVVFLMLIGWLVLVILVVVLISVT